MFERLFVPAEFVEATSDAAWLAAMLEAERALAAASARAGVIPGHAAEAIAEACRPERFDAEHLAVDGRASGNPAEPLVRALTDAVGGEAAAYVHRGATSQDIVDTAAMLVTRRALELLLGVLDGVADESARLADAHRSTPMVGRTLLQNAVPTTFGLKAAGWLVAVRDARTGLARVRDERLAVQLGGAAGTLAAFGDAGLEVRRQFARELELAEPVLAWHTDRGRIAELAGALTAAAAALAKIAVDVALLAQTEVAEVTDAEGGGSSTMPHKRNPVGTALAVACARQVHGYAAVLTAPGGQEHERGLGGWHSEWHALSGALAYTGGAAGAVRRTLDGLEVHPERMLDNLRASGGAAAERVSLALSESLGRSAAHELVAEAAGRSGTLADELEADDRVGLSREELEAALDPLTYLGQAEALVDAALR
ncbi:MAG: 3-carboxy-cis,cis-muconate cycloisomerase [Gaiellaceae bacterium]